MATLLASTLNYVPLEAHLRQQMFKEAENGIKSLDSSVIRYLESTRANGTIPPLVPGRNLASDIAPKYGFIPANVRTELTWQIVTGQLNTLDAVGICLYPIVASTPMQREVLSKLQSQLPKDSAYIGVGCNATENAANGTALTYWIPRTHVN